LGWTFSAWLPGSVHGVVVQMTRTGLVHLDADAFESFSGSCERKPTSIADPCDRVFDLGPASARAAVEAPGDRASGPVEVTFARMRPSTRISFASVAEIHRQVRMVQSPSTPEPLEPFSGFPICSVAKARHRRWVSCAAGSCVLLLDLHLDRHAVAVPARH